MKFTLSWLKDFLDTPATLSEITDKLTAIGLEVEGIDNPAETLKGFVVGHVITAARHPDADKLQCLVVDTGTEKLNVVCGAPNARTGMKGVFAPVGSYIPGSDMTLKKGVIRGQESNGMMCSERELLLSDEHNGIIELPDSAATGSDAAAALGLDDPVIEINLTPNRGDCAGIYGIARDLAAAGLGTLRPLAAPALTPTFENPVKISIADTKTCPLFIGRAIRGVKNGPSPEWLQKRLKSVGQNPISALVDITNYLTISLNRPLHVFDADKLKGHIHVRPSTSGETLEALNDKTYTLTDGMTAVCDDSGVLGLGGIIGGVPSSVTEATTNVYLEVALFDPVRTAMTGQKLQIDSDARYRFERGIDPAFAHDGAAIAAQMILDLCGGEASDLAIAGAVPDNRHVIAYAPERLKLLGGMDLPEARQQAILSALGFEVTDAGKVWNIKPPSWRSDVEGAADIVEEILRIEGYDNIPAEIVRPAADERLEPLSPLARRATLTRRILAARGLNETITWSFLDEAAADLFGVNRQQNKAALTLTNPISVDLAVMRPSVLPNLIAAAGRNADRGIGDTALFEIGNCYWSTEAEGQVLTATGLRSGNARPRHWSGTARTADVYDAKADALAVLEACGVNTANVQIAADTPEWYHPGRSGALRLGPTVLAWFGEIHPAVLGAMKRDEAYAGFEIFLPSLPQARKKGPQKELLRPSPFQPVGRDFAFIVDEAVEAEKILRAVRGTDKKLITHAEIFDVYQGKGVESGKKSIALAVTLQPAEKTLTDEEITAVSQKIVEAVKAQTGGMLRS
ncbi:MAG: phenylalanine--tRNA ligase subunit beta [Alphaproteobacteria bacterium]|nr:phenylalanine--tRNA ligase subunit beta [Alphaproteobacteria bacterium]